MVRSINSFSSFTPRMIPTLSQQVSMMNTQQLGYISDGFNWWCLALEGKTEHDSCQIIGALSQQLLQQLVDVHVGNPSTKVFMGSKQFKTPASSEKDLADCKAEGWLSASQRGEVQAARQTEVSFSQLKVAEREQSGSLNQGTPIQNTLRWTSFHY